MKQSAAGLNEADLRAKLLELVKQSASEERFIEFIKSPQAPRLNFKTLEILLDLTLAAVDQYGYVDFNQFGSCSQAKSRKTANGSLEELFGQEGESRVPELSSYDGDDEELDDTFIFPCHVVYDDCHPELLTDYHREHLKPSRNPIQIIKLPKMCEFVVESMFGMLQEFIAKARAPGERGSSEPDRRADSGATSSDDDSSYSSSDTKTRSLAQQLAFVVRLIKKINKICLNERRNCRILSKTGILGVLLANTEHLVELLPDEQHIFLEPLIKLSLTLSDYKISGANLKRLFKIIKNEETNLSVVLKNLQDLLEHQHRVLRNIHPSKSINFPTASRTPEEIEYDRYLANSWHWRLRSKVIENKRRRSRAESQSQDLKLYSNKSLSGSEPGAATLPGNQMAASSWLECSLMTPLSNISPLVTENEVKFCCSMWLSVCGDLLVVERNKSPAQKQKRARRPDVGENSAPRGAGLDIDWSVTSGHWLRLTSRRRLVRRCKNKLVLSLKPRKRRLSARIRTRQAYDQEDEERDEKEEKARKSDAELTQGHSRSGRGFKLFHSSLRRHPGSSVNHSLDKQRDAKHLGSSRTLHNAGEASPKMARDHTQEQLVHLISFALDSLTIELWLNVKCMTFYARSCRVTREGQTDVHDCATFRSHLKANGSWSNVIVCLEEEGEQNAMTAINLRVIVNGVREEAARLVFSAHKSPLTNFALLLGCERSTFGYVWKLSQVNLYKNIPDDKLPIYLLGKGPDFWSFTNFRQQSLLPLPDITQRNMNLILSDAEVLAKYSSVDEELSLNWLTQNVVISYVAHQPEHFLDYSPSMSASALMGALPADYEFSNSAERFIQAKTLDFSRATKFNQNNGFGSALVEAGGIESALMSFAEVVRRPQAAHEHTHALAFSVLLKMVQTNSYHLNKFLDELSGLKLLEYILAHPKCRVSCEMLESYLDFCLMSGAQEPGRALIKSPKLLYHLMTSWRVWHKDAKVAKMLYRRLIRLLHTAAPQIQRRQNDLDHHYIDHNFRMMTLAGGVDILMDVLRDCLVTADTESSPFIDHELIDQIVHLISLLISQPPGLDVMLDIMEFLLFLHPDPKAFVELSRDRIGFLHFLPQAQQRGQAVIFDEANEDGYNGRADSSRLRTPFSTSTSDELSEDDSLRACDRTRRSRLNGAPNFGLENGSTDSSEANRISTECSRNLAQIIEGLNCSRSGPNQGDGNSLAKVQRRLSESADSDSSSTSPACGNRNYAIARLADMLHFIIILPLSHSNSANRTLSEALQKCIIDPRKFIILANNDLPLVREKVLRLFLHFIRACYKSNAKSVLESYEQETESANYKICAPIHLMARQLVRYRTTSRMIQLCHGILGGVTDFEAADTFFTSFEIDTNNIQFQLNILVLLIRLLTRLGQPKEVVAGLRIVHAYLNQLLRINERATVAVIIENDLVDCLMNLYFSHLKDIIKEAVKAGAENEEDEEDPLREGRGGGADLEGGHGATLLMELDRLLVFIVRFDLQMNSTSSLLKSIDDLLLHFELLNSRVPTQFKHVLRERVVKIFLAKLRFCNHYEACARQRVYSGKFQYYFKSLLKNSHLNKFDNDLAEFGPDDLDVNEIDLPVEPLAYFSQSDAESGVVDEHDVASEKTNVGSLASNDKTESTSAGSSPAGSDNGFGGMAQPQSQHEIAESNVIDRFKATFALVSNFITTREPEVIPSPLERTFIMKCLKILARHLIEIEQKRSTSGRSQSARQSTQWTLISSKLERFFRAYFTRLVLYLLSPTSEGTNLDERKYFAHQILDMFRVNQLLGMLGEGSSRSNHKILLAFIKDLVDYGPAQEEIIYGGELAHGASNSEEELLDDTEIKLRELICSLESEVGPDFGRQSKFEISFRVGANKWWGPASAPAHEESADQKYRAIWLEDLAKARDDLRERLDLFAAELRLGGHGNSLVDPKQPAGSLENLASANAADEKDKLLDEAVSITKDVVNDKHEQRKAYLEDVKQGKIYNYHIRQQWLSLIIGHTHERAIWFLEKYYPKSWELNPVEGPSRTRRRLRPCKLKLEARFLRQDSDRGGKERQADVARVANASSQSTLESGADAQSEANSELTTDDWYSLYSPHPLCSLIINNEQSLDSTELRIRMFTTDRIHFNCDCSIIRPNEVCHGEVSIASWCIHFIGNRSDGDGTCCASPLLTTARRVLLDGRRASSSRSGQPRSLITSTVVEDLWFDEIVEIWDRRHQLQEVGLEIFLTNNMTYLLSFRTNSDREDFKQNLMREQHKMINLQRFNLTTSLSRLSQLWRDGKLTNFDYLTCLNKLAGRSFNDLMQYPVFPFVLANYVSATLDLSEPTNFRNLKRPMAIQNEEREANFRNVYQMSSSSCSTIGSFGLAKPYHYGNHYSNSATVLHFLVRLPPFTQMLIEYQDNNFDQPDRTFHAVANTWQLITRDSNTDFKELVPEFFFLPEMFTNIGDLELGRKQNNELVDDVRLPAWCPNGDARLFTLIHRQALESAFVSEHLHHWIDLIFGFKQTGKAAIEALNVFHPATYYGGIDFAAKEPAPSERDSLSALNVNMASKSTRSSIFGSAGSTADLRAVFNSTSQLGGWSAGEGAGSPRRRALNRFLQADIERSALETMIKTYGQMPRQLFSAPTKQRSASTFAQQLNESQLEKHSENGARPARLRLEPLKQVRGLRWGSYVGSPGDGDIIAVKHKRIILEPVKESFRLKSVPLGRKAEEGSAARGGPAVAVAKQLSKQSDKFHFCLLANGDVAILRNNTSLMLDYRADRKSSGTYQLSIPTLRHSRRAGLSRVSRMNLFSNMIISRQQFGFLEPLHAPSNQFNSDAAAATSANQSASLVATLTGAASGSRSKFSLDSLNLVSWFYLDGVVRVKHPAPSSQKPSIPLVQANTIVDTMTTCCSVPELNLLLVGYRSGSVCAHIVSTVYETVPVQRSSATSASPSLSAGPSAVHFLNTTSSGSAAMDASLLGPGRVANKAQSGEPYTALALAGKTLQSVRSMNKTSRWLYCHDKQVNCIKINVSFGIVVTGSEDGTSVVWDLNSLTFVRTIDYKLSSLRLRKRPQEGGESKSAPNEPDASPANKRAEHYLSWAYGRAHKQKLYDYLCNCNQNDAEPEARQAKQTAQQCFICGSGVNLIAISDTLGDIVTIKHLNNRLAVASEPAPTEEPLLSDASPSGTNSTTSAASLVSRADQPAAESNLTSVIYVHTINGALVNFANCHAHVTAVNYSNAPEGISINVVVVGMSDGLVRMYSSWDLSRVKEFRVAGLESPISDIMYTRASQLLYVAYEDGQMVVLRNKKKGSVGLPKEWIL